MRTAPVALAFMRDQLPIAEEVLLIDEAATQRVPNTNGSKMVPLAVSVDV